MTKIQIYIYMCVNIYIYTVYLIYQLLQSYKLCQIMSACKDRLLVGTDGTLTRCSLTEPRMVSGADTAAATLDLVACTPHIAKYKECKLEGGPGMARL